MGHGCAHLLVAGGALAATGCGFSTGGTETETFENEGQLCVRSTQTDSEAERLLVTVQVPTCLSSSCDTPLAAQCAVAQQGDRIAVTSFALVQRRGNECTSDCRFVQAECQSEPIAAGRYTVQHGEFEGPIELPSTGSALGEDRFLPCPEL